MASAIVQVKVVKTFQVVQSSLANGMLNDHVINQYFDESVVTLEQWNVEGLRRVFGSKKYPSTPNTNSPRCHCAVLLRDIHPF